MPMKGGSVFVLHPVGDFARGRLGVAVLLLVGAVAVAVLEVNPKVFDGLAPELVRDACGRWCAPATSGLFSPRTESGVT